MFRLAWRSIISTLTRESDITSSLSSQKWLSGHLSTGHLDVQYALIISMLSANWYHGIIRYSDASNREYYGMYGTSTENQYTTVDLFCALPPFTAHPFFVLTLHNHTSIESARSQHYNGVWYVFSRAHSASICQHHCSQSIDWEWGWIIYPSG